MMNEEKIRKEHKAVLKGIINKTCDDSYHRGWCTALEKVVGITAEERQEIMREF